MCVQHNFEARPCNHCCSGKAICVTYCESVTLFISVFNQLDAQNFCFTITSFHASTCFEHHVLIIRRSKLHDTASGIITPVGVMIPCRGMK